MSQTATPRQGRRTAGILPGVATPEGEGIIVHRPFPSYAVREFDPFLLPAGPPTGEPVARSGPFVMNTMAEIRQVIEKYRAGGLGVIPQD